MARDAIGGFGVVGVLVLVATQALVAAFRLHLMRHVAIRAALMAFDGVRAGACLVAALTGWPYARMRLVALDAVGVRGRPTANQCRLILVAITTKP